MSLNKSLLYWRLEHIVELHPGSHNLLFLRIVSSMLRSLAARHVGEHHQPHHGHEEHAARHRGHDQAGPGVQVGVVAGAGRVENRCGLDQPLLGRDLEHVVQLQPGRGQLLLGGPVVALALPLAPGHHEEHGEAHQGDERHPAHNGAHNQGELFSL